MDVTLYKAAVAIRDLMEQIDETTGELPDGFEMARSIVKKKAESVAAYVLENESHADMVESHAKELLRKVAAARKRSDWLRKYLGEHMKATGITEISANDGSFKAKLLVERDASVEIFEEGLLPADYMREIPASYAPDKKLIKKALDDGFDVPGARIVKKDRLEIK